LLIIFNTKIVAWWVQEVGLEAAILLRKRKSSMYSDTKLFK